MKRIISSIFSTAILISTLVSCNDNGNVSAFGVWDGGCFTSDNVIENDGGKKLFISNQAPASADMFQRNIISYNVLNSKPEQGCDYNIVLVTCEPPYESKPAIESSVAPEEMGKQPVCAISPTWIGGKYLNITACIYILTGDKEKHEFNLVFDEDAYAKDSRILYFDLLHDTPGDTPDKTSDAGFVTRAFAMVSFDIHDILAKYERKDVQQLVIIRYDWFNGDNYTGDVSGQELKLM